MSLMSTAKRLSISKLHVMNSKFQSITFTISLSVLCVFFSISCSSQNKSSSQEINNNNLDQTSEVINPENWPKLESLTIVPEVEAQIDDILSKLTLEQKVGQVIQGDSGSLTPEDVKKYRLGSVLSGGNSAPGPLPYANTKAWLEMADAYFNASVDTEGVEIAIPCIWGIDAVHGHANLSGAIVFPHNIGLGAMRNEALMEKIAAITALELTVSGHDWTFAPTLAVPQDHRWGRSYEGFSEDGAIVQSYGDDIVIGLQGRTDDPSFMGDGRVISCAKHFLADGATNKGVDQGDALITEKELIDKHAVGYYSAIPAGVMTVMASFSSWQGRKLHGDKALLTDVLKKQLGFNGFVVGDWNGHGQVPGCTNTDCPQSLLAGLDMYMAPDSWKGLYKSTLKHVKSGKIPMSRLDEAVRRILRVKIASGLFEKGPPSTRTNAGNEQLLGLPKNREIARQAVRESMVLLKNNNQLLPLDASKKIMVIGDANSISKACGGWTLSWQGVGHKNDEFPNGASILSGIKEAISEAGGTLIFSPDGGSEEKADVVIAVYGEDPYAEFQGDRRNLDFTTRGIDSKVLSRFKSQGIPVVSVFLSGRPMWCNPEINQSDAFVAAWLPGSEGGGISDLLFQRDASFDFTGRLSFSWPSYPTVTAKSNPLFELGYGLSYESDSFMDLLPEDTKLDKTVVESTGEFFMRGATVAPWSLMLKSDDLDKQVASYPTSVGGLIVSKTDHKAQEDALRLKWTKNDKEVLLINSERTNNMSRQTTGAMELSFMAKSFSGSDCILKIGMSDPFSKKGETVDIKVSASEWKNYRISLSCFKDLGIQMKAINTAFMVSAGDGVDVGLADIKLDTDRDARPGCDGQ